MEKMSSYTEISKTADGQKLLKLQNIRDLGLEPYPHIFKPTASSKQLKEKYADIEIGDKFENDTVSIAGRLMLRRNMGKAAFLNIQDEEGRMQIYISKPDLTEEEQNIYENLDIGDIIGVTGFIFRTKMGEITVHCQKLTLLTKSLALLPEKFHGLTDLELRYRQRFVDLIMNTEVRDVFRKRTEIINGIREYLNQNGFMEVETPTLQTIYGGASAFPFKTHHRDLDMEMYLRISPELYLKRLIVGGFEKVYEISRNFRNESIDTTHNPEFTMVEWYEAYSDYNDQMVRVENMIEGLAKKVNNGSTVVNFKGQDIDFKTPWRRLTIYDGLREYAKVDPEAITKEEIIRLLRMMGKNPEEKMSRGDLLLELFEETVEPNLVQPTFCLDYPRESSPLTKVHRKDPNLVERFEAYAAKIEIANVYSELNDPVDQAMRLMEQEKNREFNEESQRMDENFIHAMEIGMPPTGGVGIGIDRIVMILTGNPSIRDVLFFPAMRPQK